ncbi:MAG: MgtC/SapB family protein, partial [Clostridium sp.]
ISGVGFLGAGTILREKGSIRGLTTAATLWVVACLGLAVGHGLYSLAITGAVIVFIILTLFTKADRAIQNGRRSKEGIMREDEEVTVTLNDDYH